MITVGENLTEMRDLAVQIMRDNYRAADKCAMAFKVSGDAVMKQAAADHLASAERWRNRARRGRDQAMRDLGMVKVRGNLGGTYWE